MLDSGNPQVLIPNFSVKHITHIPLPLKTTTLYKSMKSVHLGVFISSELPYSLPKHKKLHVSGLVEHDSIQPSKSTLR